MILQLSKSQNASALRRKLIELGLEHVFHADGNQIEIASESSVYRPKVLGSILGEFGQILNSKSRTPLLDEVPENHSVLIPLPKGQVVFQNHGVTQWIAGPCSLDEFNDIKENAARLSKLGVRVLRGGAVKPRTSPHEFQGLGRKGYQLLAEAAHEFGMACISETLSEDDVPEAIQYLDMIQVGARNMQNFALLKKLGKSRKPVLLKRGPGATLKEWASAAEYLLAEGNYNVVLCERGVRGLERELRYTLDLAGAAFMAKRYGLPVVVDPSHATGVKQVITACTVGIVAMGFAGVMVETHPDPTQAKSDSLQALMPSEFEQLVKQFQRE